MELYNILQNLISGASIGITYGMVGLGVVFLWQSISRNKFSNINYAMLIAYLLYNF